MLHIVAGVLIIASSVFLGYSVKNMYDLRCKIADEFFRFINFAQSEISFYRTDLKQLIEKFAEENINELAEILTSLPEPQNVKAEDIKSLHTAFSTKKLIAEFLRGISSLDKGSLDAHVETFKNYCQQDIAVLKNDVEFKGKTFKKLSPLLGIAVLILIL